MRALALILIGVLAASADEAWSGTVQYVEQYSSRGGSSLDREELIEFAQQIRARAAKARLEAASAPPVIATQLLGDLGFCNAELERIALASGEPVLLLRMAVQMRGTRLLVDIDGVRVSLDLAKRSAIATLNGEQRELHLDPPAAVVSGPGEEAQPVDGRPLRLYRLRAGSHNLSALVDPSLPNPLAIGLLKSTPDEDPYRIAAQLPGLPMRVELDGDPVRIIQLVSITPGQTPGLAP